MKQLLDKIITGFPLDRQEAYECMLRIGRGEVPEAHTVSIMTGLQMRGLQLGELAGFQQALLELALPVTLDTGSCIDVCGTGGDGKNTFNISTTTAFVVASLGYKVVKHGNYGVSSLCGSSNVLETIGYVFSDDNDTLRRELDERNICFLHAPLFHPALKQVAPIRRSLGITTFFNGIGPLVNPANPSHQLTGTYSLELARQYQYLLQAKSREFTVVHGLEGFDELTFIGATRVLGKRRDELIVSNPLNEQITLEMLNGGSGPEASAALMLAILKGKGSVAQNAVIAGNSALALQLFHPEMDFRTAFEIAYDQLLSGKAIDNVKLS